MSFYKRVSALALAVALAGPAHAGDRPADPAGAKTIADFVAAYAGKAAAPSIKVTQDGASYVVSFDLGAASAAMKSAGFAYDPAEIKLRVFSQDDGKWRVELASMPSISGHMTPPKGGGKIDIKIETDNLKHVTVLDPALGWIASSKGGADKMRVAERGPGIEEYFEFGKIGFDASTKNGADGLTMTAAEPIESINLVMDIDPKGVDPDAKGPGKPVHVSAKGQGLNINIGLNHFQPGPILDAWRFFAARPTRADYARDFAPLKSVVDALVADRFALEEDVKISSLDVMSEIGPVKIEGASLGLSAANAGAESGFSERFAATSIKLPDGLAPPAYAPVIPTAFDFGFKASGFDWPAAAQEWFANAHLEGEKPPLDKAGQDKVMAKLIGGKPVVVDILPSHVTAPSLNIAFEGKVTIDAGKPSGAITIRVKDFDKTAKAVQGLGPQAEQQLVPVIAMAKGLGKPDPDGTLVWVCEVGKDKVMKVNGLPLGKAPF